jgi:hypothetical protein
MKAKLQVHLTRKVMGKQWQLVMNHLLMIDVPEKSLFYVKVFHMYNVKKLMVPMDFVVITKSVLQVIHGLWRRWQR